MLMGFESERMTTERTGLHKSLRFGSGALFTALNGTFKMVWSQQDQDYRSMHCSRTNLTPDLAFCPNKKGL